MAVNVEQLTTDVISESEPSPSVSSYEIKAWEMMERTREVNSRWVRDLCRTAAEEFDD